jgi:hypothetical protein
MARRAPILMLLFAMAVPAVASAEDSPEVVAARASYDRGVALFGAKDYAGAARAFAAADATVRNDVALGAAIDAAIRADEAILAMELVERAEGRANIANVADARARFAKRIGRVRVTCSGCAATLDGTSLTIGKPRIVLPGGHALLLEQNGKREARELNVIANQTTEIAWAPSTERPLAPTESGISPTWFWIGAGATVALGGATTYSAFAVRSTHREFDERGCARLETSGCRELADRGQSQQRLTNVLLGASILAAGTTTILGLYAVRWSVARSDDGAVASLHVRF